MMGRRRGALAYLGAHLPPDAGRRLAVGDLFPKEVRHDIDEARLRSAPPGEEVISLSFHRTDDVRERLPLDAGPPATH